VDLFSRVALWWDCWFEGPRGRDEGGGLCGGASFVSFSGECGEREVRGRGGGGGGLWEGGAVC